jgi:hypothetical protein
MALTKGNKMSRMKDYLLEDLPLFRASDPDTSRQLKPMRFNSQRAILLAIYADAILGLTDEEAAARATEKGHTINGYWKRCADLRTQGLIHDLGIRRTLSSGSQGMVCAITQLGLDVARGCFD